MKTQVKITQAKRGNIYDVDGNVLAITNYTYRIVAYLDPKRSEGSNKLQHVQNKEHTANVISEVLDVPYDQIINQLKKDSYQVYLGPKTHAISITKKNAIEEFKLPGIAFEEQQSRNYPFGNYASYVIGYAKYYEGDKSDEGELVGELGVEQSFNNVLSGENGKHTYIGDVYQRRISGTAEEIIPAVHGNNIYLTIDKQIQLYAEKAVGEAFDTYKPKSMGAIVVEAKTGRILASTSRPSFNPNLRDVEIYTNPLHQEVFEPGSTMKMFTYLAAVDAGVYKGTDKYKSGSYQIYSNTINDWNDKGWGDITFDEGFYKSSNVATSYLANEKLGTKKFFEYLDLFGFGKETEFGLPGERSGDIKYQYPIDTVTASFGQGISVTPIQMVQAMTMFANDGNMLQPYIIEKITDQNDQVIIKRDTQIKQEKVVSTEAVEEMKHLMFGAINDTRGVATRFKVDGVNLIGKTGTAQIAKPGGGYYKGGVNLFSFAGMFPQDDPEIIVYVWVNQPKYGKHNATEYVVESIIKNTNNYYTFDDSAKINIKSTKDYLLDYNGLLVGDLKTKVSTNGEFKYKILGSGKNVVAQYPEPSTLIQSHGTVYFLTEKTLLPDFTGLSYIDAKAIASLLNIKIKFEGKGYVEKQSVEPGSEIVENLELILEMK